MIKRVKEKNYKFKHPLGSLVVGEVEVGVSSSGRRSLAAEEINRLSRLAALMFLKKNYKKAIADSSFSLSANVVRAIIAILSVNQLEFGSLVGCQKSKISKILRDEQQISKSQALLALERLSMELARPGSTGMLLGRGEGEVSDPDPQMVQELNDMRFESVEKTA